MYFTIKREEGISEEMAKKIFEAFGSSRSKTKGFDASKHCGVIKLSIDPLEYQKEIRNEWR